MKKIIALIIAVVLAGGIWWVVRPSGFDTGAPLMSGGATIELLNDLDTNDLPEGWVHRKFLTVSSADYRMIEEDGTDVLQCATNNSASILARDVKIDVAALPILSWQWKVVQPIKSEIDEATEEGDDHPVRLFMVFFNEAGDRKAMEIIWSNKKYAPGDYKIIGDFHHYVANGLDENIGKWHTQSVDLRQMYTDIGGVGVPVLRTLGFFCDSDNTGTQSEGLFKDVRLNSAED
ncbi:MAG: DUF3047 domain-containing protein [Litoreibacter sp.]